ncbi:MAG: hypothetical protein FJ213_07755 [Ignavibacteria bacterium]|nr:hypothetical protein [Ignavibacteria bacterium]
MNNTDLIYEVDIRELFNRFKSNINSIKTLNDIPDNFFIELKKIGVKYIWLIGMYEQSLTGKKLAFQLQELHGRYSECLSDWTEKDIASSPYAIKKYEIAKGFGGKKVFNTFRKKLRDKFDIGIILDFVPNHVALDNPIVGKNPGYFVKVNEPIPPERVENYFKHTGIKGEIFLAHGKDPFFPAWKDTLQLDYRSKSVHKYMIKELLKISELCDGVRCDMSMLLLSEVFNVNWKDYPLPGDIVPSGKEFWYDAILSVRKVNPDFLFIAEVYWDKEKTMLDLGFDYVYDKKLYDCLTQYNCPRLREYIQHTFTFEKGRLVFLENHDEQRVTSILTRDKHYACAVLSYTLPSVKLLHEGQMEGRKIPHAIQLTRIQPEKIDVEIHQFYKKLFELAQNSAIRDGYFKALIPLAAWERSPSYQNFIIYLYENDKLEKDLVVVNFSGYQSQCRVKIESFDLIGNEFLIEDRMSDQKYQRSGDEMFYEGLFLELMPYQSQIFQFKKI